MPDNASEGLTTITVRTLAVLRVLWGVTAALHLVVWWSWYERHLAAFAGMLMVLAWAFAYLAVSLLRGLGPALVVANVAVGVAAALLAGALLPPALVGGLGTGVFLACSHAAITAGSCAGRRVFGASLAALAAALVVGAVLAGQVAAAFGGTTAGDPPTVVRAAADPGDGPRRVAVAILLLVSMSLLVRMAVRHLGVITAEADGWLRAAADQHRTERIAAARAQAERERERVVHDTVLNTLAGIAWGAGDDRAFTRAQSAEAILAVGGLFDGPARATEDLDTRLTAVVASAGLRGLDVTLDGQCGRVPGHVAHVLVAVVGELLTNVRRHAGTGQAWVTVHRAQGVVSVLVRDLGRGFDPSAVPADRFGLSRSVRARVVEIGGRVQVDSAPGRGTRVLVTCSGLAPAQPAGSGRRRENPGTAVATGPRAVGREATGSRVTSTEALRAAYAAGLRRAAVRALAVWYPCTGLVALAAPGRGVGLGGWVLLGAGVLVVARRVRHRPATRTEALGLTALTLAVIVGTAAFGTDGHFSAGRLAIWAVLPLPLILMLVTVCRPRGEWLLALLASDATLVVLAFAPGVPGPIAATQLISELAATVALQVMGAMGGPVLRRSAQAAAQAFDAEAHAAAAREAQLLIRTDRKRTLAMIDRDVLPMLAAVRDGQVDPRDRTVRDRCRYCATRIRRTLATSQAGALGDLVVAVYEAEERGLRVEIQAAGELRLAPAAVPIELARMLPRALRAAPRGEALLTFLCSATGAGSLTLTMAGTQIPPGWTGFGRPGPVGVHSDQDDGRLALEFHWADRAPEASVDACGDALGRPVPVDGRSRGRPSGPPSGAPEGRRVAPDVVQVSSAASAGSPNTDTGR
ncbi:Histidine kinase [Frankia sp. AiPs1]|uniref:sensor histidine kinase n=1 Tax=Frankia sp. AiPa1 TaxID=573492 RepID=UPI00202AFEBC|nr:sensor histidine kinase [Frankia sp. AiPa1]MCL9757674.1 ATP-binding protein [Frankia sp. AiPa1]